MALECVLRLLHGIELAAGISSTIFGATVGDSIDKTEVCFTIGSVGDEGSISVPRKLLAAAVEHQKIMRCAFFPSRFLRSNTFRPQMKQLQSNVNDMPLSELELDYLLEIYPSIEQFKACESAYGLLSNAIGLLDSHCNECFSDQTLELTDGELSGRHEAMVSLVRTTLTALKRCRREAGAKYEVEAERARKQTEAACARASNVWHGTEHVSPLSNELSGSHCKQSSVW